MCFEGDRLVLDIHAQTRAVPEGKHGQPWLLEHSTWNEIPPIAYWPYLSSGLPFGDCPSSFTYREMLEGVGGSNQRHRVRGFRDRDVHIKMSSPHT